MMKIEIPHIKNNNARILFICAEVLQCNYEAKTVLEALKEAAEWKSVHFIMYICFCIVTCQSDQMRFFFF